VRAYTTAVLTATELLPVDVRAAQCLHAVHFRF